MKTKLNRRSFLKRAALTAGAVSAAKLYPGYLAASPSGPVGNKLNCVLIGCGGRGNAHLEAVIGKSGQNLYAIVDPDEKRHEAVRTWLKKRNLDPGKTQYFTDYRQMYDKIGRNLDAVFIAAPNHHHALAATIALQVGVNVYCEKPLCHNIAEARQLRQTAAEHPELVTQMGNQGHCEDGYRSLCEFIWAGVIGKVTETHSWTDRANGGIGPRPPTLPVPPGLNWDSWIGPAPFRDYHSDLHPHEWHGWYDFGNGSIGNMGCHVLDGVFWALKVGHPDSIEVEQKRGGTDERYPTGCRLRWDVPARGDLPPLKAYWYEGLNEKTDASADGVLRAAKGDARNYPPLMVELSKQYPDENFESRDSGTLYVGEKGVIYTGTYGDRMHVVPYGKLSDSDRPPKTLPRPKDVFTDFITAVLEGRKNTATPFEYGSRLTEFAILGNLAQHMGPGQKVEWDGHAMKVKNYHELNAWVTRKYRKGWKA